MLVSSHPIGDVLAGNHDAAPTPGEALRAGPRPSDTRDNSQSWRVIDDDLGTQRERAETRRGLEPQGGAWANVRRGGGESVEAFPPLPESTPAPALVRE